MGHVLFATWKAATQRPNVGINSARALFHSWYKKTIKNQLQLKHFLISCSYIPLYPFLPIFHIFHNHHLWSSKGNYLYKSPSTTRARRYLHSPLLHISPNLIHLWPSSPSSKSLLFSFDFGQIFLGLFKIFMCLRMFYNHFGNSLHIEMN